MRKVTPNNEQGLLEKTESVPTCLIFSYQSHSRFDPHVPARWFLDECLDINTTCLQNTRMAVCHVHRSNTTGCPPDDWKPFNYNQGLFKICNTSLAHVTICLQGGQPQMRFAAMPVETGLQPLYIGAQLSPRAAKLKNDSK